MEGKNVDKNDTVIPSLALSSAGSRGRWVNLSPSSQPKFRLPQRPGGRCDRYVTPRDSDCQRDILGDIWGSIVSGRAASL